MTDLSRLEQLQGDDLEGLYAQVTELEAALRARDAEIARLKADLAAFRVRYRQDVGLLHDELDELERLIAEAELGEMAKRAEADQPGPTPPSQSSDTERQARFTSDAVRKLFRDVAKAVHPDLAGDEAARERRHMLMVEANQAYAIGDEHRLRSILQAWERSPEAVLGVGPEATRLRLARRIAQIEEGLGECASDLAALRESPLWKLKAMVDEAAAAGKDLVGDMVRRLERDILVARNRLDAIQWRP